MGRRDTPISELDGPAAAFALQLRCVRQQAGDPGYRSMAKKANYTAVALSSAARGVRPPTWEVTAAYLKACGVTGEATLRDWYQRWLKVREECAGLRSKVKPRRVDQHAVESNMVTATAPPTHGISPYPPLHGETWQMLKAIKDRRQLSYRAIAERTKAGTTVTRIKPLSHSTIQEVLSGKRPVEEQFVDAFLDGVTATKMERAAVSAQLRSEVTRALRARDALSALKGAPASNDAGLAQIISVPGLHAGQQPVTAISPEPWLTEARALHGARRVPKATAATRVTRTGPGRHRVKPENASVGLLKWLKGRTSYEIEKLLQRS